MVRPARPDETPRFGQAWRWGNGGVHLMSVVEDEAYGPGRRWQFLWLANHIGPEWGLETWNWSDVNGRTYVEWTLLDDD